MKGQVVAALAAAVGLAVAVSSCTSSAASKAASSAPAASPAGAGSSSAPAYQSIGGTAVGVSVDVPGSWQVIDFSKVTVRQAFSQLQPGLPGVTESQFAQQVQGMASAHGAFAIGPSSATSTSGRFFADNISAYCSASGVSQAGSAGIASLRELIKTQLEQDFGGAVTSQTDVEIGGTAGLETLYSETSASGVSLEGASLAALPEPDRGCFVTITYHGDIPSRILAEAISTFQA